MAQIATVTVRPVQGSGQFCAELRSYYSNVFVYGSSPDDAMGRLARHSLMDEAYRSRVQEVKRRLVAWELDYAHLSAGVQLTTIVPQG